MSGRARDRYVHLPIPTFLCPVGRPSGVPCVIIARACSSLAAGRDVSGKRRRKMVVRCRSPDVGWRVILDTLAHVP